MQPQPHSTFEIIALRDGETVSLIQTNHRDGTSDGVDIDFGVWQRMLPRVARDCRDIYPDLFRLGDGDAVAVPGGDHARSLFRLATMFSCCAESPLVDRVSEAWMRVPLQSRRQWWHEANTDKPLHAQILGVGKPNTSFDSQVPDWLPFLIEATDTRGPVSEIYWTYARSPLGTSCIAYFDDEPENLKACLALSSCAISCWSGDQEGRPLARAAVADLVRRSELVICRSDLARVINWRVSGHEALQMSAMFDVWRERLEA